MARFAVATVLLAGAAACALGVAAELGPAPPGVTPEVARAVTPRTGAVELAGSGSNVPLTRLLARRWCEGRGGCAVVHESIGSTGALRALRDGVIDVALVSRPLTAEDLRGGLRAVPYARTPVVLAANPSVTDRGITRAELLDVLRGARTRWGDGAPLLFVLRERGDSSQRALADAVAGWSAAEDDAQRARRFRVMYADRDLRETVAETPGALGVTDLGGMRIEGQALVPLALDGVAPSVAALAAGAWTVTKTLAFVLRPDARAEARAFVAWVGTEVAAEVLRGADYLPERGP